MTERIGITASDMQLILDVVDRGRCGERGEHLPDSVLRDLRRLVPFDEATFQVMDPYRHTMSVQSDDPAAESGTIDDLDLWWPAFWEHCAYPLVSGNYSAVIRGSDDVPGQVAGAHWSAYLEEQPDASAHHVIVSLPPRGSTDRRLILWRESAPTSANATCSCSPSSDRTSMRSTTFTRGCEAVSPSSPIGSGRS